MNKKRVLLGLVLVFLLTYPVFAGGEKENESTKVDDGRMQISFFRTDDGDAIPSGVDVNDNRWANIFKEALPHIDIEWIIVPEAAVKEKQTVLMASGDVPDIFPTTQSEMNNWAEKGMITPLDEYIEEYFPIQKDIFDPDFWNNGFDNFAKYNGQQYRLLIPQNAKLYPQYFIVNQNWLNNLNLGVPETLDELMDVMKAFTYDDPDGNGIDDTFGFSGYENLERMQPIFNAFGVQDGFGIVFWHDVDGTVIPDFIRPEMKDALAYIREMYESGIYDKDSLVTSNRSAIQAKYETQRAGITSVLHVFYNRGFSDITDENGIENTILGPLAGPDGNRMIYLNPGFRMGPNQYAVSSLAEYPEAAVQIWNWLFSSDPTLDYYNINGDKLAFGEIGVHGQLNAQGTFLERMPETPENKLDGYRGMYGFGSFSLMAPTEIFAETQPPKLRDAELAFLPYYLGSEHTKAPGPMEMEYMSELRTYFDELKMNIVTGKLSLDAFDEWVDYFYANGGQEMIDEVNN